MSGSSAGAGTTRHPRPSRGFHTSACRRRERVSPWTESRRTLPSARTCALARGLGSRRLGPSCHRFECGFQNSTEDRPVPCASTPPRTAIRPSRRTIAAWVLRAWARGAPSRHCQPPVRLERISTELVAPPGPDDVAPMYPPATRTSSFPTSVAVCSRRGTTRFGSGVAVARVASTSSAVAWPAKPSAPQEFPPTSTTRPSASTVAVWSRRGAVSENPRHTPCGGDVGGAETLAATHAASANTLCPMTVTTPASLHVPWTYHGRCGADVSHQASRTSALPQTPRRRPTSQRLGAILAVITAGRTSRRVVPS